jgi:predicted MFS family arabinose efflux permease
MSLLRRDGLLVALTATRGFSSMSYYVFLPFFGLWLIQQQSLSATQSGTVVGACVLTTRAGAIALPPVVRSLGERGSVVLAYATTIGCFGAMYALGDGLPLAAWYALSGLLGFAFSGATLALKSLIGRKLGEDQQVSAFSFLNVAVNVGAALGPIVGGWAIASGVGVLPLVALGVQVVSLLPAFLLPGRGRSAGKVGGEVPGGWRPSRGFLVFVCASSLTWVAYAQLFTVFPVYAEGHLDERVIGALFAANAAMIILLQIPVGGLLQRVWRGDSPRIGGHGLLLLANLLLASSMLCFAAARSQLWVAVFVGVVFFTLSELLWSPMYDAAVVRVRGEQDPAAAFGVSGVVWGIAEAVGASAGIALAAGVGGYSAFLIGAAAALAAGILAYALRVLRPKEPRRGRRSEASLAGSVEGERP